MMLAEAGICGNSGVADGGPFVGPGLFQPVCMSVGGWGMGKKGGPLKSPPTFFFFLRQISLAGQIIEGDLGSCGITAHSEKACQ